MDINKYKKLSYKELKEVYKSFLEKQNYSENTINTAYSDTFYLWRNGSKDLFWNTLTSKDFEKEARISLERTLTEHSKGNVDSLISNYRSHLRKFRSFINSEQVLPPVVKIDDKKKKPSYKGTKKFDIKIPKPSVDQVDSYLKKWTKLENYRLQEEALNKLFLELCPKNVDLSDVLLKVSTLNNFYSTNIFSVYPVAKQICSLDIDSRLKEGDPTLVRDLQYVQISGVQKNFYSFATKYCSHHNPSEYPIYDSFVDEVLRYFRDRDNFTEFKNSDLKDYIKFKTVLIDFSRFYGLDQYSLKEIDKYIWQIGKEYFPKNYGKKKKIDKTIDKTIDQ